MARPKIFQAPYRDYVFGALILVLAVVESYVPGLWFMSVVAALLFVIGAYITINLKDRGHTIDHIKSLESELHRTECLSLVDDLSAGIAHEINNPLGIIAQEAQWIEHLLKAPTITDKEKEDCSDSIREISAQIVRCKEIISKLLTMAHEMEPVFQKVDINELVTHLLGLIKREASDRSISVVESLAANLPIVQTDSPLLRQVVLNLLINAMHAIEKDGTMEIATRGSSDFVEISIKDSGCGISEENMNKIFTPFFTTKPQGKGSGLGLAICKGIIERLGGHIAVRSQVGRFTAFSIHLPARK
jgi:two-component system, NtrC family, sensor kinase